MLIIMNAETEAIARAFIHRNLKLVTAESCTGGWLAKVLTDLPGSSAWFERGFVTYSNAAKVELLGVDPHTLQVHGAVSRETASAMVIGALRNSHAEVGVAITGVAGPDGGSVEKPVGTVWIAWLRRHKDIVCTHHLFEGDREAVRYQSVIGALRGILRLVD
jgi:nicotinamide-nucleotide amidase